MKKVLSIVLAFMMVAAAVACSGTPAPTTTTTVTEAPVTEAPKAEEPTVTEAPAVEEPAVEEPVEEPTVEEPAVEEPAEPRDVALALNLKNKTGVTINEVYIYPVGAEEKGNSVVAAGWPDKDADGENYEKNIYIVREEGKEMEVYVVFEDGSNATWTVGALAMYDKLSMKKGTDVSKWEHEPNDDPADQALMDEVVAAGKTSDNTYPGYELIAVELKNKTGKAIKEFYFAEEGTDPKTYNNMVEYLVDAEGNKVAQWEAGKGGLYLFDAFIRPHAANYVIYVVFEDDTDLTYPIDDWFKPDGDGFLPNEISLKSAEDPDDVKVQYDDGDPEPLQYLAEAIAEGRIVDGWYPTY